MSKRTVLLITESTLGRFDLSGGNAPMVTDSWVRPSFTSQSVGTLADAGLRLGGSRRRQVYVLTTRCWTGSVSVGPDLISGASTDELSQMVALEAETLSGISAFESAASVIPLPPDSLGDSRFWLTQIPDNDLRSIDEAIRQAGAKLAGIAHPAVPTVSVAENATSEWRTLQTWDDATLLIRGCGDAIADFHSMTSGLLAQRTVQEFATFFQGVTSESLLQYLGPVELPQAIASQPHAIQNTRIDTNDQLHLNGWATAWMRSQSKPASGLPLISLPKRPMSRQAAIAISALLGLITMGMCFVHHRFVKRQVAELDADIEQMQGQQTQLNDAKDQLKKIKMQAEEAISNSETLATKTRQSRAEEALAKQIIQRGKRRWLSLVDSLVKVSDEDGWVREIQSTSSGVSIRGLAVNDAAAHRLAARLESTSAAQQWQILPASTLVDPELRLTEFAIELVAYGQSK